MIRKALAASAIVALWKLAAAAVSVNILPPPEAVAMSFVENFGAVARHSAYSVARLFAGIALAVAVGAPIGVAMGYFSKLDGLVSPFVYIAAPMPKIAFLPVIMLFMGIRDTAKVFIVFIVMVFQVIITLRDAVKKIPEEIYYPFLAARCKTSFIIANIVIPSVSPQIFTAVRVGLATGISVLFMAETFGTVNGLGFYIMDMWMRVDYPAMYSGILAMGAAGLACAWAADALQGVMCPWAGKRRGRGNRP